MPVCFLGIGSNIGERISFITNALNEIGRIPDTKIVKTSSIYETEPWGNVKQDDYLNCAVEIYTELSAANLLSEIKNIEKKLGRSINGKWTEREIDIDLLFYGNEIIKTEIMNVPHLQIENRKFVLVPLAEISPDFIHPVFKKTVSGLLSETTDKLGVSKYQISKV